ncbi:MAG: CPBP family intramembrane glutamic endopeptidase [Leptospirales bacterium]
MSDNNFNWENSKQLSVIKVILAFAIPSAVAFTGFRIILPIIYEQGIPAIIAWPAIASGMLLLVLIVAIILLRREAKELNISFKERICLKKLTASQWGIYLGVLALGLAITMGMSNLSIYMTEIPGLSVPDYFPFFLNPAIDPMKTDPSILSPDFILKGEYWLFPLLFLTLFLNILTEELYFRAWLLPKMSKLGKASWVINGSLFACYHTFQFWLFPQLLPISLFMAYVVYKSKSIWPAFAIHMVVNLMTLAGLITLIIV